MNIEAICWFFTLEICMTFMDTVSCVDQKIEARLNIMG